LQQSHTAVLKRLYEDWETHWRDCRECRAEIIPAAKRDEEEPVPIVRINGNLRFRKVDVEAWLAKLVQEAA
jgi:hypothetical protein